MALDVPVQRRRDKRAAERPLRRLLRRRCRTPRVMITGELGSRSAAQQELMPGVEHRRRKGLGDRAGDPHQPARRRERQMKRFESARRAQRLLSAHDRANSPFRLRRDHVTARRYRAARARASEVRAEISPAPAAA